MEGTPTLGASIHSLGGRREAAELAASAQRLNLLDDVWTSYLASAEPQDSARLTRDLPDLEALVGDMQIALEDVARRAGEFRFLYQELRSNEVDEALERVIAAQPFPEGPLRDQLVPLEEDGDLRGAVISGCMYIVSHAEAESEVLGKKLAVLQRGEFTEGDLGPVFKCAVFVVTAGAAIASSLIPPAGAAAATAVGVVGGCIGSWRDCRDKWRQIRKS